jgi:hypothetical protein
MRRSKLRTLRDFRQKNSLWGSRAQMAFVEIKFTSHCDDLNEIKKGLRASPSGREVREHEQQLAVIERLRDPSV